MNYHYSYFHELDRLATQIQYVSGYSLEQLLALFLKGYTLKAPEEPISLEELARDQEK